MLPKIKKKLKSFVLDEKGRISKQSMMLIGAVIGTAAIASLSSTQVQAQCDGGGGGGSCGCGMGDDSGAGGY